MIPSSAARPNALPDRQQMRDQIISLIPAMDRELRDSDNLLECGLESLHIMRLAGTWRQAGAKVTFSQLIADPTIESWDARLQSAPPAPSQPVIPTPVPPQRDDQPFDLSDVQYAYWIGRRDDQPLGGVGCHAYLELDGQNVEPARLQGAWQTLLDHHPMLRAAFDENGQQRITPRAASFDLPVHDLATSSPEAVQTALTATRNRLDHRRLRVEQAEVAGIELSLLPGGATRIHLDIDLLVADVQSLSILLRDLATAYRGDPLPAPPVDWSFATYLQQQRDRRAADRDRDRDYWHQRLSDLPEGPALPLAVHPDQIGAPRFNRRQHRLDAETWSQLRRFAATHQLTPAIVLANAFATVLTRWSAQDDILLNLPLFDREITQPGLDDVIADFTNLLLLRADQSQGDSFVDHASKLQSQLHADIAHAGYSAVQVQRDIAARRQMMGGIAPVVFACNLGSPLVGDDCRATLGRMDHMISQTPGVWLDHQVYEEDGELLLCWDVVESLFPAGVIDAMFAAYGRLLSWLAGDAARWRLAVPDLLPDTQAAVRAEVNATTAPRPDGLLHDGFFRQAAERPDRPALLGHGGPQSYGDLAQQALSVAALLQDQGVVPGDPVAITLPRGPEQIAVVLGVLAAGAVYVPVSPEQPAARATRIRAAAGIRHVLTTPAHATLAEGATLIDITRAADHAALLAPVSLTPDAPAYVIFTSGSTGEPKGVELSHAAALNTVADINARFAITEDDRVLAVSALDFDLSVQDIFGTLAAGGALVLLDETERREATRWHDLIDAHRVSIWNSAPALLEMLLAVPGGLPSLRLAMASGDWIALDLPQRLRERAPDCRFIAMGGATEAAIWSNLCEVGNVPDHWRAIPYGTPLANQSYRVADARGRDCPDWVAGELWIGGAGLATGYRGDPTLSAHRFVEHDGGRWYRTGDMGRYWPDGTLEFLGRQDMQVKVRGHRIELGEIETALEAHPAVTQAVALALGERGRQRLAAFIVAADDLPDLPQHLAAHLPSHAVPPVIERLDALPLTANGKIDRKSLAARATEPAHTTTSADDDTPQGEVEAAIAQIWADILDLDKVGRQDSFLALGGDSLMATRAITRLRQAGIDNASLSDLFARPVLRDFANGLTIGEIRPDFAIQPDPANRHLPFPPTEVQQAYLMGRGDDFDLGGVSCHFYTEFEATDLDLPRLEEVWNRLIARHEMLRAVFDDAGQQRILPTVPRFSIPVTHTAADEANKALAGLRDAMSDQVIDPTHWPLFDVRAVRYGNRTRLGVSLDSLIIDALSTMILFTEAETLYADLDAPLLPVGVSFRDYVTQVKPDPERLETDRAYWRDCASDMPAGPRLPLARDPSTIGKPQFTRRETVLAADPYSNLTALARQHGLTVSSVLATAFAEVLAAWSADPDFTINLTLFDRQEVHPDINNILGDFTSLMLLPYRTQAGDDWLTRAGKLQARSAENIAHGSVSAVWVMREMSRQSGAMTANMPIIFTSVIGMADALPPMPENPVLQREWGISQTPQVWLDCQIVERDDRLSITWDVVESLFPAGVIDAMFAAYGRLLSWLAGDAARWRLVVPDLLPDAQAAVRAEVNATTAPRPDGLLHDGFFRQAAERPERPALLGHGGTQSYGDLARQALSVAALLQDQGVAPGDPVAITLPRGPEQIAAVLGVLAAGAVYVPVSPEQPAARAARIRAAAGIRHVLTTPAHAALAEGAALIDIADAADHAGLLAPVSLSPDAPAYVIFTSGSTGEPKGVELSHAAALNTVADINSRFAITEDDRVLAVSALDFDLSVQDIFGTLAAGGALVLLDEAERREATRWHDLIDAHRVSIWNSAPALLEMLLAVPGGLPSLRLAMASGDWIALDLPARLRDRAPDCRFIAMGGATEAAIWSNLCEVDTVPDHWRAIPYGTPLANQSYRVADARGRDCPDWVAGELWIGGAGLATGYRGDPTLSAHRFVEHDGARWYRTGDMGRYWPDGTLEFLGRQDMQVKVRGHRIELGEIETALEAHPAVTQAVALALGERGRQRLAAFIVATEDPADLTIHLAAHLPSHAVPPVIERLDALPLTANGKIDRKSLAARAIEPAHTTTSDDDTPQGEVETAIAQIWADILDLDKVGRQDSFLALGGDSLMATEMVASVGSRLGVDISLRQIFAEPTIAGLAGVVAAKLAEHHEDLIEEGAL
ncbi:amino acid adenylation domain-containing protein [Paracoccus caeni]|uniref:L-cysteine--[L-cysteinyl-carrier protein] ligase n=2 Tax=Paracoccus caeni TaxID=657651 RepID=A0A934SIS9_9RHOB|nr:amino acid adenylation domain-containing protein [Paracoccus caeni]